MCARRRNRGKRETEREREEKKRARCGKRKPADKSAPQLNVIKLIGPRDNQANYRYQSTIAPSLRTMRMRLHPRGFFTRMTNPINYRTTRSRPSEISTLSARRPANFRWVGTAVQFSPIFSGMHPSVFPSCPLPSLAHTHTYTYRHTQAFSSFIGRDRSLHLFITLCGNFASRARA